MNMNFVNGVLTGAAIFVAILALSMTNFVNGILTGAAIFVAILALSMTFDVSLVGKLRSYWKSRAGKAPLPVVNEVPVDRTLMLAPTLLPFPAQPKILRPAKSTKKSSESRLHLAARRKRS